MTRPDLAGGDDLLDFLPESEAARLRSDVARGETHAARWHRHVDGTGGDLLRVRPRARSPLLVVVNSHNMAFYAWEEAARRGLIRPGAHAVHVDDHPDFFAPDEVLPPDEGSEQSLRIARGLRWNDWITAAFARGIIDRLTDISRGDTERPHPPFVAVPVSGGSRYLEAGLDRGEPHPWLLRLDVPAAGRYRLRRPGGLGEETVVFAGAGPRDAPRDTTEALAVVEALAAEGRRLEARTEEPDEISVRLGPGPVWLLALAPGDGQRIPPPLSARFDVEGTEEETGVPIRRLRRDMTTLAALAAGPPVRAGAILDVDLDWLNVHRVLGRPDRETVTAERIAALVKSLRRAVPDPGVVTVALSPECLAPRIREEDLAAAGISGLRPPPEHLGMREARRRLALFLRAWRREFD